MTAYRSFEKVPLPVEQVHSASKPRGTRFAFTAFIAHGAPLTYESDAGREIPRRGIRFPKCGARGMRIAVTGAYGFSGKYMARRLLDLRHEVITLTNSPQRPNPFGAEVPH